jgi:hypothetical protein
MNKARGTCLHKIIEIEFELDSFQISKIIVYKIMIEKHTQIWFEKATHIE